MEKSFPKKIGEIYTNKTFTNPDFEKARKAEKDPIKPEFEKTPEIKELKPEYTALDTFAVPATLVESPEKFLAWFEPRFINLRTPEDFQLFSNILQEALKILEEKKFLLSPRIGESFPVSPSIKRKVEKGFVNPEEIIALFKKVAVANTPENFKQFLSPDRKSVAGAERLSVCRILSIAYVLDKIKRNQNFDKFLEYSRYILGRSEGGQMEPGFFSSLQIEKEPEILTKPENPSDIFAWLEKGEILKGCYLNNIGAPGKERSYYIPEVHIGIKSGLRAFLKLLRDPESEFRPLDDFLRMRFVFENDIANEKILEMLSDIQEEAKKKTKPGIKLEFREKTYFTDKELDEYFPGVDMFEKDRRSGWLDSIKVDRNPSAAGKYKNLSAKISLWKTGDTKEFFAFEIQFLRRKELKDNESLEMPSNHFLFEIRQAVWAFSRLTGKAQKEEIVQIIKEHLEKQVQTEKMPRVLLGKAKRPKEYGAMDIAIDFSGTLEKKAEKVYDFLIAEGTLKKVSANFPDIEKPTEKERFKSIYFLSKKAREATLKLLGAWLKKEKGKSKK